MSSTCGNGSKNICEMNTTNLFQPSVVDNVKHMIDQRTLDMEIRINEINRLSVESLPSEATKASVSESDIQKKFEELQETIPPTESPATWEHEVVANTPLTETEIKQKIEERSVVICTEPEITSLCVNK